MCRFWRWAKKYGIPGDVITLNGAEQNCLPAHIALDDYGIERLTSAFFQLSGIEHVDSISLKRNRLKKIPEEISKCTALKALSLRGNAIKLLPESLGCLENIEFLDLADNRLIGLPHDLVHLGQLKAISLEGNPNLRITEVQKAWLKTLDGDQVTIDTDLLERKPRARPETDEEYYSRQY